MKILILTHYFSPEMGAAANRLLNTAQQMQAQGHDVEVLCPMPNYPKGEIFPEFKGRFYRQDVVDNLPVHRMWLYAAHGKGLKRLLNYLSFAATSVFGLFKCKKADIVFVNSGPFFIGLTGWLAAKLWGAKFVFNVADLWPDSIYKISKVPGGALSKWLLYSYEKWLYKRSDKVTAVTLGIARALEEDKHLPSSKINYLPNGVNLDLYSPQEASKELISNLSLENKFVVLNFGSQGYFQGPGTIVEAAENLKEHKDIHFLFVGSGSEHEKIVKQAERASLTNVTFLEPVPEAELPKYLALAHCGVVHLITTELSKDSRPTKTLALMAMKIPVIFAGIGEGAKQVEESSSGLVVEPESAQAMADAVLKLYSESKNNSLPELGGRKYLEENFSWPVLVKNWLGDFEVNS